MQLTETNVVVSSPFVSPFGTQLQLLLENHLFRRATKASIGAGAFEVPEYDECVFMVPLTPFERFLYDSVPRGVALDLRRAKLCAHVLASPADRAQLFDRDRTDFNYMWSESAEVKDSEDNLLKREDTLDNLQRRLLFLRARHLFKLIQERCNCVCQLSALGLPNFLNEKQRENLSSSSYILDLNEKERERMSENLRLQALFLDC